MDAVAEARDALRQGHDLMWTLPLVKALGPDGRRLSIEWVGRCLRRLLPFTQVDDHAAVLGAIDRLQEYECGSPSKEEIWQRSYEISFPRSEVRVAACHYCRAWWLSRFESSWEFVQAQEAALRLMLEGTGRAAELREIIFEEYDRVAAGSGARSNEAMQRTR